MRAMGPLALLLLSSTPLFAQSDDAWRMTDVQWKDRRAEDDAHFRWQVVRADERGGEIRVEASGAWGNYCLGGSESFQFTWSFANHGSGVKTIRRGEKFQVIFDGTVHPKPPCQGWSIGGNIGLDGYEFAGRNSLLQYVGGHRFTALLDGKPTGPYHDASPREVVVDANASADAQGVMSIYFAIAGDVIANVNYVFDPDDPSSLDHTALSHYPNPQMSGAVVDWCETWGTNCGQAAADRLCRILGHLSAASFQTYAAGAIRHRFQPDLRSGILRWLF